MIEEARTSFEGWAILELMGHRRLAGYVREETIAGAAFVRIDVPEQTPATDGETNGHASKATQFYAPAAIYCITPTTEAMAVATAGLAAVEPVAEWEAKWARPALLAASVDDDDDGPF